MDADGQRGALRRPPVLHRGSDQHGDMNAQSGRLLCPSSSTSTSTSAMLSSSLEAEPRGEVSYSGETKSAGATSKREMSFSEYSLSDVNTTPIPGGS